MTKLPFVKPDCCAECPLIGKIPQELREYGSYETLICLGTMDAMTQRQSNIRASKRDSKHPLHRYCDTRWEAWQQLRGREFPIAMDVYNTFRMPFEMQMQPAIRFHKRGRPKKPRRAPGPDLGDDGSAGMGLMSGGDGRIPRPVVAAAEKPEVAAGDRPGVAAGERPGVAAGERRGVAAAERSDDVTVFKEV